MNSVITTLPSRDRPRPAVTSGQNRQGSGGEAAGQEAGQQAGFQQRAQLAAGFERLWSSVGLGRRSRRRSMALSRTVRRYAWRPSPSHSAGSASSSTGTNSGDPACRCSCCRSSGRACGASGRLWSLGARRREKRPAPAPPCRSSVAPGGGLAIPAQTLVLAARLGTPAPGRSATLVHHQRHSQ